MRRLLTPVLAAAVGAATVLAVTAAPASAADRAIVLDRGHIDLFDVTYDRASGELDLLVGDDTGLHAAGKVLREPEDVTIAVDDARAATPVPDDPAFAFLGDPGDTIYLLPQTQQDDLPWPGWSTERLASTLPDGVTMPDTRDAVRLDVQVQGPGAVHAFQSGSTGGVIDHFVDTSDADPDTILIRRSAHVHTEWTFSEQGEYTFTVTPSATTTAGTLAGDPATYHVRVGDAEAPAPGLTVTSDRPDAEYLYGQGITLTATPDAQTDLDHYHWFIKGAGQSGYVISNRSSSNVLKLPTSPTWNGAQVVAKLYDDDHTVMSESAPITLSVHTLTPTTTLTATADKAAYQVGETARFVSSQSPQTADDHYHWYVRRPGEEFYTWIDGTREASASLPITRDLDGATVAIRLFNADHAVLAESAPLTLRVGAATTPTDPPAPADPTAPTDPTAPPAVVAAATSTTLVLDQDQQRFGDERPARATVAVTSAAGAGAGTIELAAGDAVLAAAPVDGQGRATVTLPGTLEPGRHALVAAFRPADPARQLASRSAPALLEVQKARPRLVLKAATKRVEPGTRARLVVRIPGGLDATGRVRITSGGDKLATARLVDGRAVIRLPRLPRGTHRVKVRFTGDAHHAGGSSTLRLRVGRG